MPAAPAGRVRPLPAFGEPGTPMPFRGVLAQPEHAEDGSPGDAPDHSAASPISSKVFRLPVFEDSREIPDHARRNQSEPGATGDTGEKSESGSAGSRYHGAQSSKCDADALADNDGRYEPAGCP